MLLSPAPKPNPITYASISAYFGKEGFTIETRILRDLGKDLANHFIGKFNDRGPSGSRIYDNDTWDMWEDIVRWKLQKKNRPQISELLSKKYGRPVQSRFVGREINGIPRPPAPPAGNKRNALEVVTGMINREWKGVVKEKNDLLKRKNRFIRVMQEQHHHQLATYEKESELRHQMLLQEQEKSRSLEERLHSLDTVAPKRKELLSKAAKLNSWFHRKERNKILDELTSLELNPESVEEEGD